MDLGRFVVFVGFYCRHGGCAGLELEGGPLEGGVEIGHFGGRQIRGCSVNDGAECVDKFDGR